MVGLTEIGQLLGVTAQRADQIAGNYTDFPKPIAHLASGRVWSRQAIETWALTHGERRPGRPRKERRDEH